MIKDITKLIDESLGNGWKMSKLLQESSYGLLHNQDATYDNRTVYNREDLWKLAKEGFKLDENVGLLALNILLKV